MREVYAGQKDSNAHTAFSGSAINPAKRVIPKHSLGYWHILRYTS